VGGLSGRRPRLDELLARLGGPPRGLVEPAIELDRRRGAMRGEAARGEERIDGRLGVRRGGGGGNSDRDGTAKQRHRRPR
jgi:hypothetical protein